MSKKMSQGTYIGILKRDLSKVTAERDALGHSLASLQDMAVSGPQGAVSLGILLHEAKVDLAEAVATNKGLTDELEFQAHRYALLSKDKAALARSCSALESERDGLQADLRGTRKVVWAALGVALVSIAVAVGLQQGWLV